MSSSPSGTNSEVFLLALPALARAADKTSELKQTFFVLMRYWLSFPDERNSARSATGNRLFYPGEDVVKALIHAARMASISPTEDAALEMIITRHAVTFSPAAWMQGCH